PAKEGQLYVQHSLKFGAKRWKKSWFVLYPASQHGVARLEFFDCKDPGASGEKPGTKRLDKKIVRLADCVSVAPASESGPKEGTATFCLETSDRSYLFAAQKQQSTEWVGKLCEIAFGGNAGGEARLAGGRSAEGSAAVPALEMAVNSIYCSRDEVNSFWVTMQRTEAAERCGLYGTYQLRAERDGLALCDPQTKETLYEWPYRLLRRYGRDKVMFSFEAGRRCRSGPGNFTFETKQGNEIFRLVEASIREQKTLAEEHRQSCDSLDSDCPSVMQIRSTLADLLNLELPAECDGPAGPKAGLAPRLSAAPEEKDALSLLKARSLPEPPTPQSKTAPTSTPPRSPLPKVPRPVLPSEDVSSLYSEPLDSVKGLRPRLDPLYSDPIDSKLGAVAKGPGLAMYNPVRPEDSVPEPGPGPGPAPRRKEHIYDEPEGRAPRPPPDAICIYDEARLVGEAWRTQGLDDRDGYEFPYNPNSDYSVPPVQPKAGAKGPKPIPAPKPQAALIPKALEKGTDASRRRVGPGPDRAGIRPGLNSSNNNNKEVLYSHVLKPPRGPRPELCVDDDSLTPVYEDLGEI
ncbi:PREDICTED: docking protein 1, partial [Crocodylus porosus]|uniref:docking protein 1 n=1 Tax=Crocodylus porosus TaxID=8502 RepID=UPI00093B7260